MSLMCTVLGMVVFASWKNILGWDSHLPSFSRAFSTSENSQGAPAKQGSQREVSRWGVMVWAASELQTDGAGGEMDALSISDLVRVEGKKTRSEGAECETEVRAGSAQAGHSSASSTLDFGKDKSLWGIPRISVELGTRPV